jgi:hypothetical protein
MLRGCFVPAAFVVAVALSCRHAPPSGPPPAPGSVEAARAAVSDQCTNASLALEGPPPSNDCCQALTSVGDALLAAGQQQAAYDDYENTRSLCLRYHPVRRRIYELRFPDRVAPSDAPMTDASVDIDIDVEIESNGDLWVVGLEAYLDGTPWPLESAKVGRLAPGIHHVNVELYVQSRARAKWEAPVRIDAKSALLLPQALAGANPVSASVLVQITDSGEGKLTERITQLSTIGNFRAVEVPSPKPAPAPPPANAPIMLPPNTTVGKRLSDVNDARHKPSIPPHLNQRGMVLWGLYKVCVNRQGTVERVRTIKSALNPAIDLNWKTTIRTWRYQPYTVNGRPVPFCSPVRLQVTAA